MPGGLGPQQPNDALTAARFSITIDGYEIASFSELSGISTEVEAVDFLESSDKEVVFKKLPGKRKPPHVVLKRGKNSSEQESCSGWLLSRTSTNPTNYFPR